jgi:hypothetical protein
MPPVQLPRELLKQNQALREKEADQLKCLDMYEAWVKTCSSDTDAAAAAQEDSIDSSQLPVAARLHRRVQKLKQILRPQAADTQEPSGTAIHVPGAPPGAASQLASSSAGRQGDASGSSSGRAASGGLHASSAGSNGGGAAAGSVDTEAEKMARWFASATPEDLNYFRTMTSEELAGWWHQADM